MLYNLVICPHRVAKDAFADRALRDPVNPFVQLLWERGNLYEKKLIAGLELGFVDLGGARESERARLTLEAMLRGDPLIYGGRIEAEDLVGEPDLLRREGPGYAPIDIKSGAGGEDGEGDAKPKLHYAVQLALYVDVLEKLGLSAGRKAYIWDVHGKEVPYYLRKAYGRPPRRLWDRYTDSLAQARAIVAQSAQTLPALCAACKQCHWRSACMGALWAADDLTLIPELGRDKRDTLAPQIPTVKALAAVDPSAYVVKRKTVFAGIGVDSLVKFHRRAQLLSARAAQPYLKRAVELPEAAKEIFFDIEVDPLRDFVYLHGFIERIDGSERSEDYHAYFADTVDAAHEESAFRDAWDYLRRNTMAAVYYYSSYECTIWKKLATKYPSVCSAAEVEAMFAESRFVDLYAMVKSKTEWPTYDHSIKTLGKFLGFKWRDSEPSGAASIAWFDKWVKTGDMTTKWRIMEYNEDDCRAMRVLLQGIRKLQVKSFSP